MLKSFSRMSDSYKIALLTSVFFLLNVLVSSNLDKFTPLTSYIAGFAIGLTSAFVAYSLQNNRSTFVETDVQLAIAVDLCKQLSLLPARVVKGTPTEVVHLVYAAKAYFPDSGKSFGLVSETPDQLNLKTTESAVS